MKHSFFSPKKKTATSITVLPEQLKHVYLVFKNAANMRVDICFLHPLRHSPLPIGARSLSNLDQATGLETISLTTDDYPTASVGQTSTFDFSAPQFEYTGTDLLSVNGSSFPRLFQARLWR